MASPEPPTTETTETASTNRPVERRDGQDRAVERVQTDFQHFIALIERVRGPTRDCPGPTREGPGV